MWCSDTQQWCWLGVVINNSGCLCGVVINSSECWCGVVINSSGVGLV